MNETPTAEEIQQHYNAAMDSVNLINSGKPADITNEEWQDMLVRNVEHLKIMLDKDFWNGQDLTPLQSAINSNDA